MAATSYVRVMVRTHFTPTPRTASAMDSRVVRMGLPACDDENVLAAGGGGVGVVHHHQQAVVPVEDRVADTAGEAVVPEAAIAHDADGALARSPAC